MYDTKGGSLLAHTDLEVTEFLKNDHVKIGKVIFPVGSSTGEPASHSGFEFVYIIEGRLEVVVGTEKKLIEKGNHMCFDAKKLHYSRNLSDEDTELLFFIYG